MTSTRNRRAALLLAIIPLVLAVGVLAGCQQKVISDTTYSREQMPQFSRLPRTTWTEVPVEEETTFLQDIGNGFKSMFEGIGKLNPF
jgi:hypothetical protein